MARDEGAEEVLSLFDLVSTETAPLPPSSAQMEAVNHEEGAALVLAAPGSGTTWVITQRFCRLVRDHRLAPTQILALTYNKAAAAQMQERILGELGPVPGTPNVMTYNAFAAQLIRECGRERGWHEFRLVESAEQELRIKAILDELRPANLYDPNHPMDTVREVNGLIQRAKQELLTASRYKWYVRNALRSATGLEALQLQRQLEVVRVYKQLQKEYRRDHLFDHDDAILKAIDLIRTEPIARRMCDSFAFTMVDEYQDTNTAQAVMVKEIVGKAKNLLVVADDDQAIYRFRGASTANIQRFRDEFPMHKTVLLLENRRSTPEIIGVAQAAIEKAEG